MSSLRLDDEEATTIYIYNHSVIELERNLIHHERKKNIDTIFHFIREKVDAKEIQLEHVRTHDQLADIFIKLLKVDLFKRLWEKLGMVKELNLRGSIVRS